MHVGILAGKHAWYLKPISYFQSLSSHSIWDAGGDTTTGCRVSCVSSPSLQAGRGMVTWVSKEYWGQHGFQPAAAVAPPYRKTWLCFGPLEGASTHADKRQPYQVRVMVPTLGPPLTASGVRICNITLWWSLELIFWSMAKKSGRLNVYAFSNKPLDAVGCAHLSCLHLSKPYWKRVEISAPVPVTAG